MSKGISDVQIEEAFRNIDGSDINNNFVGAFPSNHMNKFSNHKLMISEKREISVYHSKYR